MGSLAPEAGSGRKPPRGTAAPRDGARAPAFSGSGSAAKGVRVQPAGSPPRSLSWPRAGGRVRPPGEGRRGESARERAGTARARRAPAARAPPPGKQRASTRAAAAPSPPPALASELADCAAGRSRAGRRQREATVRGGLPRPLRLAGSSRPRPAELPPPPFFPRALGGATLRPEPGTAQPPPTFNVPHSPARASSASFFPSPPFPPPSCLHFLKEGFFSLSLPHIVAARERAGRAAEVRRRGRGAAWGAAGAAAAVGEGAGAGSFVRAGSPRRRCPRAAAGPAGLLASLGARRGERCPRPPRGPPHKGPRSCVAAVAGRGSPRRARKFVALLGALFVCFPSEIFFFVILDKMSVRDVKIERGTLMARGALQKVPFEFCFSQGGSSVLAGWIFSAGRENGQSSLLVDFLKFVKCCI